MIRLLQIEMKKIMTYRTFWVLIGLYFLFLALGIILAEYMLNHMIDDVNTRMPIPLPHVTLYFFPDVWQNITFFASIRYVMIFPAIIILILITNEFTHKTIRQNIINGMTKTEFLVSKILVILILALVITVVVTCGTFILGAMNSDAQGMEMMWRGLAFVPAFFIQVTVFMILAFFFGFLIRNTGLAIALFTLYSTIIEPVTYFLLKIPPLQPNDVSRYLPVNAVIRLVEYPAIPALKKVMGITLQEGVNWGHCGLALGYGALLTGIVFFVLYRKDL